MRHTVFILLIVLVVLFFQGAILHLGIPVYCMPEFVTILIVYLAFNEASVATAMLVFVLGLLIDFSSAVLIGPWAGAYVAVFGVLALISHRLFIDSSLVAAITAFVASLTVDALYMLISYEYRPASASYPIEAVGQAIATALFAPLLLPICARLLGTRTAPGTGRTSPLMAQK